MSYTLSRSLRPSGLLGEVVETTRSLTGAYYGYNVTKTEREPIDQIHGFLAAKRLNSDADVAVPFYPFVAGLFEVLNATALEARASLIGTNTSLEARKAKAFGRLLDVFGLRGQILLTRDMWNDERYWLAVDALLRDRSRFSRKALLRDTLRWYKDEAAINEALSFSDAMTGFDVPPSLLDRFGDWPAPLLYTPLEVAEAIFLHDNFAVTCKIGHMEERVYDKYIVEQMDLVHLRQPADLKSTLRRPRGVTPYIDKERRDRKIRLYFEDDAADIAGRIAEVAEYDYLRTVSDVVGEIYHPVVDKAVLAIEAAVAAGAESVAVDGCTVRSGSDLVARLEDGDLKLEKLRDLLPDLVVRHINNVVAH